MSKPDIIGCSWGQVMPLTEMVEIEAAAKLSYTSEAIHICPLCECHHAVDMMYSDGNVYALCLGCFHAVEIFYHFEGDN